MDSTHMHLILNHFPIIGILIGTVLLLYGVLRKNETIQKTALIIISVMTIITVPVFLTGEPAEEKVENIPGVLKAMIEEHEEAAEVAFWSIIVAGIASIITMVTQMIQSKITKPLALLSLLLSLVTSALMIRTGYLGGQIRHTEISANNANSNSMQQNDKSEKDND